MVTTVRNQHRFDLGASGARIVNILLGVWLFISAFVLPRTEAARLNTWIIGLGIVVFAIASMFAPALRWVVTACSVWLFFSTLAIRHVDPGSRWNNLIIAVIVFFLSLAPAGAFGPSAGRGVPPPQRA